MDKQQLHTPEPLVFRVIDTFTKTVNVVLRGTATLVFGIRRKKTFGEDSHTKPEKGMVVTEKLEVRYERTTTRP